MSMSKKDFISLADHIKSNNAKFHGNRITIQPIADLFTPNQLDVLADFCCSQNPNFNRSRWLGYIAGENGPSGGQK
jgi:hypothetical protein